MLGFGRRRRRRLRAQPLAPALRATLASTFPAYERAGEEVRAVLDPLVQVFLGEKRFEGAGGQEITDEIRATIAAQACWLLVGMRPERPYPRLRTVIVYPWPYSGTSRQVGPGGVVTEATTTRAGESWSHAPGGGHGGGPVVLAWDQVRRGARREEGLNVVFHEFAHRLDAMATGMDGAPSLGSAARYEAWAEAMQPAFDELRDDVERGRPSTLRPYGATNPAEFFAVATEVYFERPAFLRERLPEVHEQLRLFYRWSPDEEGPIALL